MTAESSGGIARAGRYGRAGVRWVRLLAPGRRAPGIRVSYGHDTVPEPGAVATGPTVKFQRLAERFGSSPADFTVLYLGSTLLPRDLRPLLWIARRRGAAVILNQDGVGYPAWNPGGWQEFNEPLRVALHAADHVLYQSAFCRRDADRYLGATKTPAEVLHNPADVVRFTPAPEPPVGPSTVLVAGDQTSPGRLVLALRTFAALRSALPDARLLVTGRLPPDGDAIVATAGLGSAVQLVGRYSQADAPALYRQAHVLLHTKVNDPCPNVVLEALASGLPVVYPASGGTPELVGEAGVAVPHEESHEVLLQPSADAMAEGVVAALGDRERLSRLARQRAVERFSLERWLERHAELFADLVARRAAR
jgi:glycosyltransferase involved in cell wall biosynthesis